MLDLSRWKPIFTSNQYGLHFILLFKSRGMNYSTFTEPVLAVDRLPIAAFITLLLVDRFVSVLFLTSEFLIFTDPKLAVERLPIAALMALVLVVRLVIVDFSIFEPSAITPEESVNKLPAIRLTTNFFMVLPFYINVC